nr:hypothetical protein [Providencia rettgeri]
MTVIFGFIECFNSDDEKVFNFNKKVLDELPTFGACICKDMFAMLPIHNKALCYPTSTIIHFVLEDRNEYFFMPQRKNEFESLLTKLCWTSAMLIETYSGNRYEWRADASYHNKLLPIKNWSFTVFESHHYLKEIEYGDEGPIDSW